MCVAGVLCAVCCVCVVLCIALYPLYGACERLRELFWEARRSSELQMFEQGPRMQDIRARVAKQWGLDSPDRVPSVVALYDMVSCPHFHGVPLPAKLSDRDLEAIEQ